MDRFARLLRRATVEQWEALERRHAEAGPSSAADRNRLLGLYLLVVLVLIAQEYAIVPTFRMLPDSVRQAAEPDLVRRLWWAWLTAALYVVLPVLYARRVMGLRAGDLGLAPRGLASHWWLYVAGYGIVLPFVVIASTSPAFLDTYPFYADAADSWRELLLWEGSYAVQFMALETFFRGVMLFAAFRVLGPWAIPAMVIPYAMIHFGKPAAECVGAIIAGSALGIVALRTRSIYAGMVIHIGVAWTMDLLALSHEGSLQELLGR
jgi:membrane protease YdiL (CAAX protease family)